MNKYWTLFVRHAVLVGCLGLMLLTVAAHAAKAGTPDAAGTAAPGTLQFELRDFLGRTWRNESVRFPLSAPQLSDLKKGKALMGPDQKPAPCQLVATGAGQEKPEIQFLADLNPFETKVYRFADAPANTQTDLKVEETPDLIRLSNAFIGISIHKQLKAGTGPIEAIRLLSGKWVGGSSVATDQLVKSYSAKIVARGPVFSEVVCRMELADQHSWELRFRIQARDPVVLVDEAFDLKDGSTFRVDLGRNFHPDSLFYRSGKVDIGKIVTCKIPPEGNEPVFVLEPWFHWNWNERRGLWFGLYDEKANDLLAISRRDPAVWVDPQQYESTSKQSIVPVIMDGNGPGLYLPLNSGQRRWIISAHSKEASLAVLKDNNLNQATLPQECMIKHSDFPLDLVKDYVYQWKADDAHPRLFLKREALARFRETFKADETKLERYISVNYNPVISFSNTDGPVAYYLSTGNPELGKRLAETVSQFLQETIDDLLKQDRVPTLGYGSTNLYSLMPAMHLADIVLAGNDLSPELRERVLAQVAFIGYTMDRPDYFSPERNFRGSNPGFSTVVHAYKNVIASLIPSHPRSSTWQASSAKALMGELDYYADKDGGWYEAPHYAMLEVDSNIGPLVMQYNAGLSDELYNPKLKRVMEWFGKISTPPDSRSSGHRHLPPIGNTYISEPTGEFGLFAYLWRDKDPEFASHMQWMYRQQGSWPTPGVGGFFPALAGYRQVLLDPTIPEKAPQWKSELFEKTGVILRNGFPSDRETQLYLIAGSNHSHYDDDSGSFTLWGKGRILADDWGYTGPIPGDHNKVESNVSGAGGNVTVREFASAENFDYVKVVKDGWRRQIAFVKNPDPLAPNYYVVGDSFNPSARATWRLWLTAGKVTPGPQGALVEGKEDVDMDILFAAPQNVILSTEDKTRTSGCGIRPDGVEDRVTTTQTGLIATFEKDRAFMAVLYPRLKTEKPAVITPIAEGRGVKVQSGVGLDYVFVSPTPISFKEGDVSFEGTVGAIQKQADRVILSLGAAGSIAAQGQALDSDRPASKQVLLKGNSGGAIPVSSTKPPSPMKGNEGNANMPSASRSDVVDTLYDEGFEDGDISRIYTYGQPGLTARSFKGNPVEGDETHKGDYCLAINMTEKSANIRPLARWFVDPTKMYRISLQACSPDDMSISGRGYAYLTEDGNKLAEGGAWAWSFGLKLTPRWQTVETTVGPQDSQAEFKLPAGTVSIGCHVFMSGVGTMYIDDVKLEEIRNAAN